jgi:branched-chain amino acid transport system substrate-binding protein
MHSHGRLLRLTCLAFGLTLLAAACGDSSSSSTTTTASGGATTTSGGGGGVTCDNLKIGFFGALTGDNASLGINIEQGMELAIEQFNADNPDCQVGIAKYDSQGSPDQAPALAQQAVNDVTVVAMVGPAFSGESRAADPILDEAGLPLITPSATGVDLASQNWKVFHRALANDAAQGPADATLITDTIKATKVDVIDDNSEYGKGLADIVRSQLSDGGTTVGTSESIDPTKQDFSSTVNNVIADSPDVVFYGGYYAAAGLLAKQLKDAGFAGTFVSGDGTLDQGFIDAAGADAANGSYITCACAPSPDDFASAYKAKWGDDPGTYSPEAYDAANMFLEAIKAGNIDRESINTYISAIDYTGLTKEYKFDSQGEVAAVTIYAYKVADGAIEPGTPVGG